MYSRSRSSEGEEAYRNNLPPSYDGSRFSLRREGQPSVPVTRISVPRVSEELTAAEKPPALPEKDPRPPESVSENRGAQPSPSTGIGEEEVLLLSLLLLLSAERERAADILVILLLLLIVQ